MKNVIKYIALLISGLFLFTGCIDENPEDQIGAGDFYKTTEDINKAVVACYNGMQSPIKKEWALTEIRSDNARHYGANSSNQTSKELYDINNFRVQTSNSFNQEYWEATYHNIANCNTVLQHINVVDNATLKSQYEAEAKFIRAYHYFNLVRLYGPLFIVTERINMEEANKAERSSIDKVYTLIVDDLIDIIGDGSTTNMLPKKHTDANTGRADIWAAKSLLAKVYLQLGQLNDARTLLRDVELNSGYGLVLSGYADVFSVNNEMNKEIIFNIRFKEGGYGLGSNFANYFAPANSYDLIVVGGGDGYNCPTDNLRAAYELGDKRRDISLVDEWINRTGDHVYIAYVKKYWSEVKTRYDGENDWSLIRFADILLMLAEIENELSGPDAGLLYLNQTRIRAGLLGLNSGDVPNKHTFRMALEKERRAEFAFENHRFFDLLRTKRLASIMKNYYETEQIRNSGTGLLNSYYTDISNLSYLAEEYRTLEDWQYLLPIPYSVMTVAPNATQNPGY